MNVKLSNQECINALIKQIENKRKNGPIKFEVVEKLIEEFKGGK